MPYFYIVNIAIKILLEIILVRARQIKFNLGC